MFDFNAINIILPFLYMSFGAIFVYLLFTVVNKINGRANADIPKEILSFHDVTEIIDTVVDEVLKKHALYYRLRDVVIISDMEKETTEITKEIIKAFSNDFVSNVLVYYTKEYFYNTITRKVQLFLVEYTDKHKPKVK